MTIFKVRVLVRTVKIFFSESDITNWSSKFYTNTEVTKYTISCHPINNLPESFNEA